MPAAPSSAKKAPPTRPRKKRRWWKVLVVLLVLLAAAALWLNGPGARWILEWAVEGQLEKRGLSGEFQVEGRLWDGFTLKDAAITGPEGITAVRFDELGVEYELADLLDRKIERLTGKGIELVLEPGPERTDKGRPDPDFAAIADTLRKARELVLPVGLDFEQFHLTYARPDGDPLTVEIGALRHDAGSERFEIRGMGSNALGDDGLPVQDVFIDWEPERLALSPLDVFPEASVERLELTFPPGGAPQVAAVFRAGESTLEAVVDDSGTFTGSLAGAPLELAPLLDRFAPRAGVGGTLEALRIEVTNLLDPPAAWTVDAGVTFAGGTWKGGSIPAVEGTVTAAAQLTADLRTAAGVRLVARSQDAQFAARRPGTWFQSLPASFDLTVPSVHAALREGLPAAGKDVPDLAVIPDGAVTAKGTLTIGGARGVGDVAAEWTTRGMIYAGDPVPDLDGTLALAGEVVDATAALAAPRPEERLDLTAQFNLATSAYEGSVDVALPDPSWLNPLIPGDDPLWRPTGPLAATWNGSGVLPDATHRGALQIDDLSLLAPEANIVDVKTKGTYQWPGELKAESVSIRNGDLWLEGSTVWEDGRVTIPVLRLHDKTGPLASLEGSAPLAADALSLEGFLKQDAALNLKLGAKSLQLARLATLLPLPAVEGYEALFSGDLAVGGSPGTPTIGGQLRATGVRFPGPEKLPALAATIDLA
ncbi:MAG: hypothetical protein HKN82_15620, partial [Akkermansiaceae bacterium]|nr:hypothetical protein [Akkermansiaceae bacterium]